MSIYDNTITFSPQGTIIPLKYLDETTSLGSPALAIVSKSHLLIATSKSMKAAKKSRSCRQMHL